MSRIYNTLGWFGVMLIILMAPLSAMAMVENNVTASQPSMVAEPYELISNPEVKKLPAKPELIKEKNSSTVYLKLDQKVVAPIANMATLRQIAPQAAPIKIVPQVIGRYQLDSLLTTDRVTPQREVTAAAEPVNLNYRLIKEVQKPDVYLIDKCGKKRPIVNWQTFSKLSFNAANIETVKPEQIKNITSGAVININNMLVKYNKDERVFKRQNDQIVNDQNVDTSTVKIKDDCEAIELPTPPAVVLPTQPGGVAFADDQLIYTDQTIPNPNPEAGGFIQGYVSLKPNTPAIYRKLFNGEWLASDVTPSAMNEVLKICQTQFPGVNVAQSMDFYRWGDAHRKYIGMPNDRSWRTFACISPAINGFGPQPRAEDLGAIIYWYGKVNRHSQSMTTSDQVGNVNWVSDPDGVSGADIDTLTYCKKWFPTTQSVYNLGITKLSDWHNRGNVDSLTGLGLVYACSTKEPLTFSWPPEVSVSSELPVMPRLMPTSTVPTTTPFLPFPY